MLLQKKSFVAEFLTFMTTLALLNESPRALYAMPSCIKELMMIRAFNLELRNCLDKNIKDKIKLYKIKISYKINSIKTNVAFFLWSAVDFYL